MSTRMSLSIRNSELSVTRTLYQNITYQTGIPDMFLIKEKMITLPNVINVETLRNTHITLENAGNLLETISIAIKEHKPGKTNKP